MTKAMYAFNCHIKFHYFLSIFSDLYVIDLTFMKLFFPKHEQKHELGKGLFVCLFLLFLILICSLHLKL